MSSSTGLPSYQVRLKNQSGTVVAIFDDWRSLSFTHSVNKRGTCRFEINGEDSRIDLFELDGQIEVWRRNQAVGLDWYLEWEGFYRTTNDLYDQSDNNSFVAYGFSYLDLARRAHIMYRAGTTYATKNDVAETVMKELVKENIGEDALAANGREADNVMTGLIIQADSANGPTWDDSVEDKNLLDVLQDISSFSTQNADTVDFDIVCAGALLFEFRAYSGQRGTDRSAVGLDSATGLNGAGNAPVTFSLDFGNMTTPVYSRDRTNEFTVVYALGRGTDSAKQVGVATSTNTADSPWNRIERVITTNPSGEDQSGQLTSSAQAELEKGTFDEKLNFKVLQLPGTYYGLHYTWGDLVQAQYKDYNFTKKIVEVRITVSKNVEGESIDVNFADK